ncbi:MAG: hypothetical protein WBR56_08520 [Sedimenticolaceae bacterium]
MHFARLHFSRSTESSVAGSTKRDEIAKFLTAMDAVGDPQSNGEEFILDALTDFFARRCRNTRQLQALGAGLFTALRREASCSVTAGMFDEQFAFRREQEIVRIAVDQQQLAKIPLDIAIRLATLLHGARHLSKDRQCAA